MDTQPKHILIIEDESEIAELIELKLKSLGYIVTILNDSHCLFSILDRYKIDLILLDIMLPHEDGLSLCRKLRQSNKPYASVPIIFLSALGDLTDRVVGLEIGGDDYLPKPFAMQELVAKIRALLRRSAFTQNTSPNNIKSNAIWTFGSWKINTDARYLIDSDDVTIALSSQEFRLLMLFLNHPQKVLSRDFILDNVTGRQESFDRSIDVQISRLRSKLKDDGRKPNLILTMRGDGYMLAVEVLK